MINIQRSFIWWFAALTVLVLIDAFMPARWWFSVRSVHVEDTIVGVSPKMTVDRVIKRPFTARWRVELERITPSGRFVFIDASRGDNSYTIDADLPNPLTLDWWIYPETWNIKPGQYRIQTCWTLKPDFFSERTVCNNSNTFRVYEPP